MKISIKHIFAIWTLTAVLSAGVAAGQVNVIAQVDTGRDIYVGERFAYNIIIDGENKPGEPDLSPLSKYNPQSSGNQDVSQTSISIVNGRTTQNVVKRYVMGYSLAANQTGVAQIPPVSVTVDGQVYRTNPVSVNILQPGTTENLDVEMELSQPACFVGEPVVVTVKFYILSDIGDFQFNIPAFNGEMFYIEDPDVADKQAKPYRIDGNTTALVSQTRVMHNYRDSVLLSFSKVLIPKQAGQIQLEPVTVSADVVVGRKKSSQDPFFDNFFDGGKSYKRFMVSSKPAALTVQSLPEDGRPAQFYGLVGRYTISADASPVSVNVGDPITLTIKIGGSKYLKPVQWPQLEQIPAMAANFKIPSQQSSPVVEDGSKVFTQTIRANNDKVTEIPPIPLAFFDTEAKKYAVAATEPIKLTVAPTKVLTSQDLEGSDFAPVNKEVEAIKKGLSANYEGPDVITNMGFSPSAAIVSPAYAAVWAVPLAGLILSSVLRALTHTTPEKVAQRRRRRAAGKAVSRLRGIVSLDRQQQRQLLGDIMKQYIGERFDRAAGSLTAADCHGIIMEACGIGQLADDYSGIVSACEAGRYAPVEVNIDAAQIKKVITLVGMIEKKSKR